MGRCAGPAARGTNPRGLTRARAEAPELREALPLPLLRGGKPKSRRIPAAHRDRAVKSIKGMLRTLADVDDEVWQQALEQRLGQRLEHLASKRKQLLTFRGHFDDG